MPAKTDRAESDRSLYKWVPELLHERIHRHWQDWAASCQSASLNTGAVPGLFLSDLPLLGKIWACSEFAALTMIRNPPLYFELAQNNSLNQSFDLDRYRLLLNQRFESISVSNAGVVSAGKVDDTELMQQLRHFRQQQMLRIAWRDLAGIAGTAETLHNLTDLAECCIDITLERLYQEQCRQSGIPLKLNGAQQRLVVLGMGKLGGHELNFSSDIDLIFAYPEEGQVEGAPRVLANSQFFTRLGQRFIKVLNDVTADGFVFRVDMRLRPYGESGPLVMSHAALEQYYQSQGRDWERYAMIKARVVGGDREEGRAIMDMLKPFVYRRYLDFGAFESIREMKRLIDTEIRRKGNFKNIKLGSGGIREIEFIGQTFQLIRAGSDVELQIRGIVEVLSLLAEKSYLDAAETQALLESYDFLRRLENRLQMYGDAQTHRLPEDEKQQLSMALAMGYKGWNSLFSDCEKHRQVVHASFTLLLHNGEDLQDGGKSDAPLSVVWLLELDREEAVQLLEESGIAEAAQVYQQLKQFAGAAQLKSISAAARQRLDVLVPSLLQLLAGQPDTAEVLKRLINLLHSVLRRSVYLSLLNEYPVALQQLVRLCAASPWIAHLLSRYPVLLDELLDPRNLYRIQTEEKLKAELDALVQRAGTDEEQQIERLRMFKQAQVLKIATMDMADVLDVFEVSDQLSEVAQALLDKVMTLAWDWMVGKYGEPVCVVEGVKRPATLGIVAYGKMGGRELGYGSDLDLVFLHDSEGSQQQTEGECMLDNSRFFARLAQRIIHLLGVQTANGRLYEIDMRLRPDGSAGMLVSSLQAYDIYQHEKAWTWEHQALIRARMVCFSPYSGPHLKTEFDRIRHSILIRQRDRLALITDIAQMRAKMRNALGSRSSKGSHQFHLKQDAGGLVDIEFLVQYGVLLCASANESLTQSTASRQLLTQLGAARVLSATQAEALLKAYYEYRGLSHRCALQERSSVIDDPAEDTPVGKLRLKVKEIWLDVIEKHISE
ncbi:Glutamate-ammonia-ligase adenylyltransferase [hydrothermal vent metagenome]|uniref:Glutamate-ammonia-ligase adenylyltransferase n=1 Tax=hydrothermal vent metagenome TaxID=652676 RepID=A0A3B0Y481_9ZZZZ